MRTFIFSFSVLAPLILCKLAHAQNDSLATRFLDEVVISASRSEQHVKNVPRSISVINQEQIEASVYNSVGDLLSQQEGVYLVGANQTPGTNQALFLRGANSNQVLVMIDGIRVTDPSSPNNAIDISELSLGQVTRIEILKGSHSTLFGSAAVGGVVNIITKAGGKPGLHGSVSLLGGSLGNSSSNLIQQANLTYSIANGLYISGSLFNQNVNGLNAAVDTTSNRLIPTDKDDFEKTDGSIKLGFQGKSLEAFVSYKSTFQRTGIDNGAFADDDNNNLQFYRNFWSYGGSYQINSQWKVKAIGSISNLRRLNENDSSLIAPGLYDNNYFRGTYYGDMGTHEGQINYDGSRLQAVLGGGQLFEKMNFDTYFFSSAFGGFESKTNYDTINTKATTAYIFGQVKINTGQVSPLSLTIGSRYSDHSLFGSFLTYEVNPSLTLDHNMLLYGSYATGFNAPSLFQLYDPSQGGTLVTRGNDGLKPEESQSVELGIKKGFSNKNFVTISFFSTRTKNVIEYVYLWNKNTAISNLSFTDYQGDTYINLSHQSVIGMEISGFGGFGKFDVSGNVTWLKGNIMNKASDLPIDYTNGSHVQLFSNGVFLNLEDKQKNLARRPQVTVFTQLRYNASELVSFNINYRLAGSRFDSFYDPTLGPFGALTPLQIESYSLIDIGANIKVSKNFRIAASVENIFNTNYQEINGFSTRGRSAYLKAVFKW